VTRATGRVTVTENKLRQAKEGRASFAAEALDLQRDEEQAAGRRDRLNREHADLVADGKRLRASLDALVRERATPLANSLSDDEAAELAKLGGEVEKHRAALVDLTRTRAEVRAGGLRIWPSF
jgi:structural maintenance of chromosome 3 (chondroitin sulfate proteoglycan 6)